jgi:hypothetical protein
MSTMSYPIVQIPEQSVSTPAIVEEQSPTSTLNSPVEEGDSNIRPFNTMEGLCAEMGLPYPLTRRGTHIEIHEVHSAAMSFCNGEFIDISSHECTETKMKRVRRRASSAVSSSIRKLSGGASQIGRRASQVFRFGTGAPALVKANQRAPLDLDEMRDELRNAVAKGVEDGDWVESVEERLATVDSRTVN